MFSSPAVQIYSSENAENHVHRKQGPHQLSRKPFIDRSVNGKSPVDKNLKLKSTNKEDIKQKISPKTALPEISSDLDGEDFMFSGKDMDDIYNDAWPPLRLGKQGIMKILRDYSYPKDTPPPSPTSDFDYLKLEPIDSDFLELLPKDICNFEEPMLLDESFEVDLPQLQTFEDLDTSF